MEAVKLSYIGSPVSLGLSCSTSSRGTSRNRLLCALKSSSAPPTSSPSCDRPLTPSPQLSVLSFVGALSNFVGLPAVAAEEALESSSSAADTASMQVSESAGASAVQSSVESAVRSSVDTATAAASQAIGANTGDGNLIINVLGTASFIGLSLLTIGVVYLVISDFLEKRKRDEETKKLNEEAASAKKKQSGSLTAASRGGAKGFGKKREEEE